MSPLGLVVYSFIIAASIKVFVGCTPRYYPSDCPQDFSLDPPRPDSGSPRMIHCWAPGSTTPSLCVPSSCKNHPVCEACTETATGIKFPQVECHNEYHQGDGAELPAMCVDNQERFFTCSGTCEKSLSCSNCGPDNPRPGSSLQRRANPFSASMNSNGGSHASGSFFGPNFNLRP